MAIIADFRAIAPAAGGDTGFGLSFPGDPTESFNFFLEPDVPIPSRSILAFVVHGDNQNVVTLRVRVNAIAGGQAVYSIPARPYLSTLHEIINPNVLQAGANNNVVEFTLESLGNLRITDVVILYQRNIP